MHKLFSQAGAEWATVILVIVSGASAGHYAAGGMTPMQMMGAITAVLGSVTAAVAVRIWPAPQRVRQDD
jgi:hypothetical protein